MGVAKEKQDTSWRSSLIPITALLRSAGSTSDDDFYHSSFSNCLQLHGVTQELRDRQSDRGQGAHRDVEDKLKRHSIEQQLLDETRSLTSH